MGRGAPSARGDIVRTCLKTIFPPEQIAEQFFFVGLRACHITRSRITKGGKIRGGVWGGVAPPQEKTIV